MDQEKSPDWLIDNIAEASKNARGIYFLFIGFLAYCSLTLSSTTDRALILNEAARLPIINVDISILSFFIVTPLLAIFIFIYLQLYLLRINGLITDLRTNYPSIEKRRLYPWMLNIAEDPEPGIVGRLQKIIVNISLWWFLPIVLILFPLGITKKHDALLSVVIGLIPLIGTSIVIWFWCQFEQVKLKKFINKNPGISSLAIIVLTVTIFFMFFMIPSSLSGNMSGFLRKILYVDLSYQKLVHEQNQDYETLYWVNLGGANLAGGNFTGSILKKADLRSCNLRNAIFDNANLQGADLTQAQLQGAFLVKTRLQNANLNMAKLQGAHLIEAQLQNANLRFAKLQKAYLCAAHLDSANLIRAQLDSANLLVADLQYADLSVAQLRGADLFAARLRRVILVYAQLQNANLLNVTIDTVSFINLYNRMNPHQIRSYVNRHSSEFEHLNFNMLRFVKTLNGAKLDPELKEEMKQQKHKSLLRPSED